MTQALPYFKFYPADFSVGTCRLSATAIGHYIRLLCAQWEGGPLPTDIKLLDRISPGVKRCWDELKEKFEETPAGLVNPRLERERVSVEEAREFNHNRAKLAAEVRHGRRRSSVSGGSIAYSAASNGLATSSARSMLEACSEQSSEQCSKGAKSEVRSQKSDHPTHSGGGGVEGVDGKIAAPPEPEIPPLEALHQSAIAARDALVRRHGDGSGAGMFDGAVRARMRQIRGLFSHFGVNAESVLARAAAESLRWPWDQFDSKLATLRREAEAKDRPAGWLISAVLPPTEPTALRLAAASA